MHVIKSVFFDILQKVREPFLEAVKLTLGDRYTEYMANVYALTIDFILKGLRDGYQDNNHPIDVRTQNNRPPQIIVSSHPVEVDYLESVQRHSIIKADFDMGKALPGNGKENDTKGDNH